MGRSSRFTPSARRSTSDKGDQVVFGTSNTPPHTWPFHVLLSVQHEADEVERIGQREGWRAKTFGRGMRSGYPPSGRWYPPSIQPLVRLPALPPM